MPYTATNIATLATELATALGDSTKTFWVDAELRTYLRESLRTWHCLTTYWRGRKQFATAIGTHTYDLRSPITPAVTSLLTVPANIGDVTNDIQYALMEPVTDFSGGYTPIYTTTLMYEDNEIDAAIMQAIAQFNFDTGVVVQAETALPLPLNPDYTVDLPEQVTDVRHAQLLFTFPAARVTLRRQDEFDSTTFASPFSLLDPAMPYAYSLILPNTQPALRIIPPSDRPGQVEIISIRSTNLPPQDWMWAVKWLALYFLLTQDGQCRDYYRAAYCKKRYDDALILARLHPSVLQAYVNNLPLAVVESPSDMDCYSPGWQNLPPGLPGSIIAHGWNLLTLSPTPNAISSITLEMAITAPTDTNPLQLAQEHKQVILDYAKHLATFKMGGAEFGATQPHYDKLFDCAKEYNSKLSVEAKNFWVMRDRAAKEKEQRYQRRSTPSDSGMMMGGGNS